MEWYYKRVEIWVDNNGMFKFTFDSTTEEFFTLQEAKEEIDKLTKEYFTVYKNDIKNALKKLDSREKDIFHHIIDVFEEHKYDCDSEWDFMDK